MRSATLAWWAMRAGVTVDEMARRAHRGYALARAVSVPSHETEVDLHDRLRAMAVARAVGVLASRRRVSAALVRVVDGALARVWASAAGEVVYEIPASDERRLWREGPSREAGWVAVPPSELDAEAWAAVVRAVVVAAGPARCGDAREGVA